jgi:hypothetical protein
MPGPSFARDPGGDRLYAAWDAGQGDGRDVFIASSPDAGASWLPATPVPPSPGRQFLPAVGVAPGGRVDVVFYDSRRDPRGVMVEVVVGSSWDQGRTFTTAVASDKPFDSRIGLASTQGLPQLGNQLAVASRSGGFLAFWADTRGVAAAGPSSPEAAPSCWPAPESSLLPAAPPGAADPLTYFASGEAFVSAASSAARSLQ